MGRYHGSDRSSEGLMISDNFIIRFFFPTHTYAGLRDFAQRYFLIESTNTFTAVFVLYFWTYADLRVFGEYSFLILGISLYSSPQCITISFRDFFLSNGKRKKRKRNLFKFS